MIAPAAASTLGRMQIKLEDVVTAVFDPRLRGYYLGMVEVLGILTVVSGFTAILGAFVLLALRIRRRGLNGAVMSTIDEIYNPGAHRARFDVEVRHEHLARPSEGSETSDSTKRR
jgi:hypothetical protein